MVVQIQEKDLINLKNITSSGVVVNNRVILCNLSSTFIYVIYVSGSRNYIKLPPPALEPGKEYVISLKVSKTRKIAALAKQFLLTGSKGNIVSIGVM